MSDTLEQQQSAQSTLEVNDFEALLNKEFKPKSEEANTAVKSAVNTLVQQALQNASLISNDSIKTIEGMIAELDKKLSEQMNAIIHHEDFENLESAWRGLSYLVNNTQTSETLKLRVLNVSKKDLAKTLKKFKGTAWDQSPIFKKLYEDEYGTAGGEPYGAIIGDYYFNHSPQDIELLKGVAQIASAAHAPFISSADPSIVNLDSWQDLANPRDISKIFSTPEYAAWRSFRESDDSRYVALTLPRVLSRVPYGANTNPVEGFNFEETTDSGNSTKYNWMNAAYAMGVNINRSFADYGWCARIRGVEAGGIVESLPTHTFPTDDGGVAMKCPTEIAITDRREAELSKNGFLPLVHWKNTDYAVFLGGQTVNKPKEYDNPDATANASLSARLPYIFATSRFAHYLKCIVRDKVGSFKERADMERWLSDWISNYVTSDPSASEEVKAKYPLAEAKVTVEDVEGQPGYYTAKFYLRPHYQLEGLTTSLRLTTKVPTGAK
ncbi:MAG: type VI secretion system contractile sheath large subunit [Succinatimonas sp.]|jgi:type VI secretion system protein ImpC|nr:type VI secretion system contractile sheath large subunit [Succinatimonas sp.]MDD5869749.1 type VI secretion system contractile sheath large subunit [Succinatimonas sp.]MDY5722876.1 type VI secretion system contractile sheath large subunit [Succinivibrio sp.]